MSITQIRVQEIHAIACVCDGCKTEQSISLDRATASEMERLVNGHLEDKTGESFLIELRRGYTRLVSFSANKVWNLPINSTPETSVEMAEHVSNSLGVWDYTNRD